MRFIKTKFLRVVFFPTVLLFVSCDTNQVFEAYKDITDNAWYYKDSVSFEIEVTDTNKLYNSYYQIRHAHFYPYNNIWLKIKTTTPSGQVITNNKQLILAQKDGKWLGDCMGDICDGRLLMDENISFHEMGLYTFTFYQDMRINPLPGVMSVGIRIEFANTNGTTN